MTINQHALCARALRFLALDQIEKAQSGHPGVALGLADVIAVLWRQHYCFSTDNTQWLNRDRFVFSNGHASALYYAAMHLSGLPMTQSDLQGFRALGSHTPGHPERDLEKGIEVTTGPLGQGLANAVGMAMARHYLAQQYNQEEHTLFDYSTYAMVGDGCLMEGLSHEACSLAGCLGLSGLIVCWDDNQVSIDGDVKNWMPEDVVGRFKAYGWHVIAKVDGHDPKAINSAFEAAKAVESQPVLICFQTKIGYGSEWEGDCRSHGQPLGAERIRVLRQQWDWPHKPFDLPDNMSTVWHDGVDQNAAYRRWLITSKAYEQAFPDLWRALMCQQQAPDMTTVESALQDSFHILTTNKQLATRKASSQCLHTLTQMSLGMVGGSADLSGSTGVSHAAVDVWLPKKRPGSFIHFGVREFAMFAVANGLATCAGLRPYVSTFLVFSDYGINAVRLAAMMRLPVVFIFSHDSIAVGEDGPTHQPVEHLCHLRSIPHLSVWRPANTQETFCAWREIIADRDGPSCLILTRQSLPQPSTRVLPFSEVARGAYMIRRVANPVAVIMATGSECSLALQVADKLAEHGMAVQVVSVPCLERFEMQPQAYRRQILLGKEILRVAIEASSAKDWYAYVSDPSAVIAQSTFGSSGKGADVYAQSGFTVTAVVAKILTLYAQQQQSILTD